MTRPEQIMAALRDPGARVQIGDHPADLPLLAAAVRVAYADGRAGRAELDLLRRLRPELDDDALLAWVAELGVRPLDLAGLAAALPEAEEREDALLLLGWFAVEDNRMTPDEAALLAQVRRALVG